MVALHRGELDVKKYLGGSGKKAKKSRVGKIERTY